MRFALLMTLFIVCVGVLLYGQVQIPHLRWLGHLPGDLIIRRENIVIYVPLTTSFIFSVLFSLLLRIFK
jgi:hypothetical protein